jgi:SAM-dependent methyltransferase
VSLNYWENKYGDPDYLRNSDYDGWLEAHAHLTGGSVLDLGCGAGTNIPMLLACGARVTAADFSPNAVERLERQFAGGLQAADCFDMRDGLPYADASFDAVVADLSLHYFSWQDTRHIIAEIRRVLRDGGCLLARVHSMKCLPEEGVTQLAPGYYLAYGCARRYFTVEEANELFADWPEYSCTEKCIRRYDREKHILEILARNA